MYDIRLSKLNIRILCNEVFPITTLIRGYVLPPNVQVTSTTGITDFETSSYANWANTRCL